jgi:hypothetical protein
VYLNAFQPYCCILKESHEFLCTIGGVSIVDENNYIFNFVGLSIGDKNHLGLGAHLRKWQRKQNVKR